MPRNLGRELVGMQIMGALGKLSEAAGRKIIETKHRRRAGELLAEMDQKRDYVDTTQGPRASAGELERGAPISGGIEERKVPTFSRGNLEQLRELQRVDPGAFDLLQKLTAFEQSQQPQYKVTNVGDYQQVWKMQPGVEPELLRERRLKEPKAIGELGREKFEGGTLVTYGSEEKGVTSTRWIADPRQAKDPMQQIMKERATVANRVGREKEGLIAELKRSYPSLDLDAVLLGEVETPKVQPKPVRKIAGSSKFITPPEDQWPADKRFDKLRNLIAQHEQTLQSLNYPVTPYREWVLAKRKAVAERHQAARGELSTAASGPAPATQDSARVAADSSGQATVVQPSGSVTNWNEL